MISRRSSTAGSTLIFDALKAKNAAPVDFAKKFMTISLDAPDALTAPTVALLYQGGYLTIDRRIDGETVALRVPNEEVRSSLYRGYMSSLFGTDFELDDFAMTAKETARELVVDELGAKFTELLRTALPTGAALSTSASTTIPPSARSTWSRPSTRTDGQVCRGSSVQRSF